MNTTTNYLIYQLYRQAETMRHREFYRFQADGDDKWVSKSWSEFFVDVKKAGRALYKFGAKVQDMVVISTVNCPEALIVEYACYINRMATVPVYSYSSSAQFNYITYDTGVKILFVGDYGQYELAYKYCQKYPGQIKHIILLNNMYVSAKPEGVQVITWNEFLAYGDDPSIKEKTLERVRSGSRDDIATIIYTSGTMGDPKGVIITHKMYEFQTKQHLSMLENIPEGALSLSFLPMSHVFERTWLHFCVAKGLRVAFNRDPRNLEQTLQAVKPNIMCCVPRFWEKVYTGIMERYENMSWLGRMAVRRALHVGGKVNIKYRRNNRHVPGLLWREYKIWDRRFFRLARKKIGIPEGIFFPTAGAPLSDNIIHFIHSIGIDLRYGYGMTETTASVSFFPHKEYEIGTVGRPLSHINIKIDDSGEIYVKGPTVSPGYYHNDAANKRCYTSDGWFKTGDAGFLDKNGNLILSSRKKDLIKTSTGKFVAPQVSEKLWASNRYIDEVAIVGEGKKYITALVVPNFGYLEKWAYDNDIKYANRTELCENPQVKEFMLSEMQHAQADMAEYEKVKNITLLVDHFSREKGEVTNTMKLRRAIISNNYAHHISKMYPDENLDKDFEDIEE